jgi:hypothetical protein
MSYRLSNTIFENAPSLEPAAGQRPRYGWMPASQGCIASLDTTYWRTRASRGLSWHSRGLMVARESGQ